MKRAKLVASLMMCVMCLSFLVVGVWAVAVSVNFNLNAGLKYYPEGVYVELSGQVYRGSSADNLTALTYDPRFTLEPTTNYDNSTGEPSGNFPIESWEIGSIPFIPTEKFVKIEVTVVNHSEMPIGGSAIIIVNDNADISTLTNVTATEDIEPLLCLATGQSGVYSLLLEINDSTVVDSSLNISFDFGDPKPNYNYFTINSSNQITGLTQTYIDDSPEVLVIPGYTQDGLNSLSIVGGTPTAVTFQNILTNTNIVIFQEGFTTLLDRVIGINNIKIVVIPASLTYIGGYNLMNSLEKAYFTVTEGWDTNYPPVTPTSEILSDPYTAAECLKSVLMYGMSRS